MSTKILIPAATLLLSTLAFSQSASALTLYCQKVSLAIPVTVPPLPVPTVRCNFTWVHSDENPYNKGYMAMYVAALFLQHLPTAEIHGSSRHQRFPITQPASIWIGRIREFIM